VSGIVSDVNLGKLRNAIRLLAKMSEAARTTVARDQMSLHLSSPAGVKLVVEKSAQRQQAAFHKAISR
jgi:hypothetical protein